MVTNFWYPVEWSDALADQPMRQRMLGQDFVVFRDSAGRARCISNNWVLDAIPMMPGSADGVGQVSAGTAG